MVTVKDRGVAAAGYQEHKYHRRASGGRLIVIGCASKDAHKVQVVLGILIQGQGGGSENRVLK